MLVNACYCSVRCKLADSIVVTVCTVQLVHELYRPPVTKTAYVSVYYLISSVVFCAVVF